MIALQLVHKPRAFIAQTLRLVGLRHRLPSLCFDAVLVPKVREVDAGEHA